MKEAQPKMTVPDSDSRPYLPLSRPQITEQDIAAVIDVLRSGWITTGSTCQEFELAFADTMGCKHAVAVTSGTAGLHLILHAMGIGPGDEVITPSMTWVSTVNLITLCGARPVFVDVDPGTLMVTADRIEAACTDRTRLIVPVHFAGASLDLDPIRALAAHRGIPIVEDAAHASGTTYKGSSIAVDGTSVFSFHPIKNLTTGEGGMLCTDDEQLAAHVRQLRFHGLGRDAFDRHSQGRSPQAEVIEPGYKYNLPDMNATLGLSQLARLDEMNTHREMLANRYLARLADVPELLPLEIPACCTRHAWHLFVVRIDSERAGLSREEFMQGLADLNIGTGIHFRAVHEQKYYRQRAESLSADLPNTEWNSARVCSLPLYPDMQVEDVDRVVDASCLVIGSA